MRRQITRAAPIAILAAAALSLAACGSSNSSSSSSTTEPATGSTDTTQTTSTETTAATTGTETGAGTELTVIMTDYAFTPKDATATAGKITINAPNQGKILHELVLIRTSLPTDKLPLVKGGRDVNEEAFPVSQLPGEIPDVDSGATKSVTVTLKPGRYVMLCNVPGHYQAGMVGTLTVQ